MTTTTTTPLGIGTGFSFDDGEQILVSVQKPLGLVLEQDHNDDDTDSTSLPSMAKERSSIISVADVDLEASAGRAGIRTGDVLVAVQNASTESLDLEEVLELIGRAPKVVNLRFLRTSP